jgi:hypothetical protein
MNIVRALLTGSFQIYELAKQIHFLLRTGADGLRFGVANARASQAPYH